MCDKQLRKQITEHLDRKPYNCSTYIISLDSSEATYLANVVIFSYNVYIVCTNK